jgi:hypothetical protein
MTDLRVTTISGMDTVLEEAAVTAFKQSLRGQLIAPGDERYEEARQVWNAHIDRRPGLICCPAGAAYSQVEQGAARSGQAPQDGGE